MSKYVLMPMDMIDTLLQKNEENEKEVQDTLDSINELSEDVEAKLIPTLNPQDLILMLASSLNTAAFKEDKLNDKVLKVLWPVVEYELREKRVL